MSKQGALVVKQQREDEKEAKRLARLTAEIRVKEILATVRTLAEHAGEIIEEHELHFMNFDITQSHGTTEITWYNSSESC
ncbi:hypothetical protein KARL1_214 [Acinetobacter phage KARL-1]|uniref:Uncharacterized protein n=2 Tax=Lazarusvirus TaxID=2842820 RepID=A0A385IIV9_9CAUD|nr:hypothetical protein HYP70_gp214 [Acinetobacter phage KARL-1]YP_009886341.1 hypothetical protein HYQ21_gp064 [Acinetobacter phage vB_AbaM_Apostate]AXY82833.1 hypothetical protein KARL1_214 [Acinetobacter phage KARL-1]QGZ15655.1 hypothetical protein Apostate_064 [Acinetobacter phage vB_AbaM_Apostate]WBF78677.1 hypothetical protein ADLP1_069 [Acinetobacter phage vB_AbaM_DLP1]